MKGPIQPNIRLYFSISLPENLKSVWKLLYKWVSASSSIALEEVDNIYKSRVGGCRIIFKALQYSAVRWLWVKSFRAFKNCRISRIFLLPHIFFILLHSQFLKFNLKGLTATLQKPPRSDTGNSSYDYRKALISRCCQRKKQCRSGNESKFCSAALPKGYYKQHFCWKCDWWNQHRKMQLRCNPECRQSTSPENKNLHITNLLCHFILLAFQRLAVL